MTTNESAHDVSAFELDVHWASGRPPGAPLEAHAAECERCRAYLESLAALAGSEPETPRVVPIAPRPRAWVLPVVGALALVASVLLGVRAAHGPLDAYVATKGTPAVELLIHRDQTTGVWDGRSPVHPGDSLAVRVACEGLREVTVASPAPAGWARLSEAACPAVGDALPFTLVVDDEPGDEQLAIVLSQRTLDDAPLSTAIGRTERDDEVWVVKLVLPKTVARP